MGIERCARRRAGNGSLGSMPNAVIAGVEQVTSHYADQSAGNGPASVEDEIKRRNEAIWRAVREIAGHG